MAVTARALRETLTARKRAETAAERLRRDRAVLALRARCADFVASRVISEAWLIGSAAWGSFGVRSDVDVVVRGLDPAMQVAISDELARAAGTEVDLLRIEELAEGFRTRVFTEGERLA